MAWFKIKKNGTQTNLLKKAPEYKQKAKNPASMRVKVAGVLLLVAAILILYWMFALNVNQTSVNAPVIVNLTQSGGLFSINSNQYFISLAYVSVNTGTAYVHLTRLPILINPILNITLTLNNITKINAGTNYSNIGMQLQSLSENSITVKLSPLFTSLQIAPDTNRISMLQGNLYGQGSPTPSGGTSQSKSTSTATTTVGSTTSTTTIFVNNTSANINAALKRNSFYALMLNFSIIYGNTTQCTQALYNSAYVKQHGSMPSGPNTFQNITPYVPYNMSMSQVGLGSGNYNILFTTKTTSPLFNNAVASTIEVNASTQSIYSNTTSNAFQGLNYAQLKANYLRALSIGGPCGVSVP